MHPTSPREAIQNLGRWAIIRIADSLRSKKSPQDAVKVALGPLQLLAHVHHLPLPVFALPLRSRRVVIPPRLLGRDLGRLPTSRLLLDLAPDSRILDGSKVRFVLLLRVCEVEAEEGRLCSALKGCMQRSA